MESPGSRCPPDPTRLPELEEGHGRPGSQASGAGEAPGPTQPRPTPGMRPDLTIALCPVASVGGLAQPRQWGIEVGTQAPTPLPELETVQESWLLTLIPPARGYGWQWLTVGDRGH